MEIIFGPQVGIWKKNEKITIFPAFFTFSDNIVFGNPQSGKLYSNFRNTIPFYIEYDLHESEQLCEKM